MNGGQSWFTAAQNSATSTTWGPREPGLLLRVSLDEGMYMVTDFVGRRYGHAPYLGDALAAWMEQVDEILAMQSQPLGEPIASEIAAYKKALSR